MYETIAAHGTPLAVYKADLLAKHGVTQSEIDVVIDGVQVSLFYFPPFACSLRILLTKIT